MPTTIGSVGAPDGDRDATSARPVTALRFVDGEISFVHPLTVDGLIGRSHDGQGR
jgi:hypothetical protein